VAGQYATSHRTQFVWLMKKFWIGYWRSPAYNLTRMIMTVAISIFYGTMYLNQGSIPSTGVPCPSLERAS
jgi:ABC-2 type transporter